MYKLVLLLIMGIVLLTLFGFKVGLFNKIPSGGNEPNKIQVVASFYPLYFFAKEIGGDRADIFNITPASAEPHDYEPTAQEIARIQNSRLLILNGNFESWGNKVRRDLDGNKTLVVIAGDGLQDPHIWLDPVLAKQEANRILEGFKKVDQQNAVYYENNTRKLEGQFDKLHTEYKTGLARCIKKDMITSHTAFGYLANKYGLNQIAITGISPEEEPSAHKLAELADFVKKTNIKYIFFESLVNPKLSQTLATETGAQTLVLDSLEGIPEEKIKKGVNYFSIMRNNLINLQTALECAK